MMSNTHTPGPWSYISRNIEEKANWCSRIPFAINYEPPRGSCVAPVADVIANPLVEICDQPHAEANARLIAAAPDLLAALKIMTAFCRLKYGNLDELVWAEICKSEAVIKKAEAA